MAELGGRLFVLGGLTPTTVLRTCEEYDARMGRWVPAPPMLHARASCAAAAAGGHLYVLGGIHTGGHILGGADFAGCVLGVERLAAGGGGWEAVSPAAGGGSATAKRTFACAAVVL